MSKEKYSVQAETMIEELEKLFGKGTVLLGIEKEPYGDIIPSSSFSFNYASGIGGVAKKKIYDTLVIQNERFGLSETIKNSIKIAKIKSIV